MDSPRQTLTKGITQQNTRTFTDDVENSNKNRLSTHVKIERNEEGDAFVCFYSSKSVFSNHHLSSFVIHDVEFNCSEQYFIYKKARTFKDKKAARKILKETNPVKQKQLGRQVQNFDKVIWDEKGYHYMKKALKAKFGQSRQMKRILLSTEDATLVECAPRDRLWGIGYGIDNPNRLNKASWRGKNLLGKALMEVRASLRRSDRKKRSTDKS
uniref:DUF1768 domain-containing protein n=1 Tax=Rhabditophanes sp. KR3021 TaxID=114890 RepID=A0AC35TVW6_9BILA